jgi:RNA polymerase sigma-70 factor (ECF subfamily)
MTAAMFSSPAMCSKRLQISDDFLVGQVCKGDASAIQELFDRHATAVFSVAMCILAVNEAAEDVLHEVFMQFWREPNSFQGLDLAGSLILLGRNRAIDRLRNRRVWGYTVPAVAKAPHRAQHSKALSAFSRMHTSANPVQHIGLHKAFFEGKTPAVIATELGETLGFVKAQLRKSLQQSISTLSELRELQSND